MGVMGRIRRKIVHFESESAFQHAEAEAVTASARGKGRYFTMLGCSIAAEVVGTIALKYAEGFTILLPSLVTVAGYGIAISMLVVILRHLPLGLVYGIWGGVGTVATMAAGVILWGEPFTAITALGVVLIVGGVYLLNKGTDELEAKRAQKNPNQV